MGHLSNEISFVKAGHSPIYGFSLFLTQYLSHLTHFIVRLIFLVLSGVVSQQGSCCHSAFHRGFRVVQVPPSSGRDCDDTVGRELRNNDFSRLMEHTL